ncbi:MAG: precorrin-3B C(17)-methyltransferase, partial [Fervidobacterium sp.]
IDFEKAQFEIVPGVTSATAVSNLVGCVVTQDFATISLSDYLVPWDEIEKRLENFSKLDITLAIYNPISSKRINNFEKAIEILRKYKAPDTLVVICENAYREGERIIITNIRDFDKETVNMNCTIIVCPSNTKLIHNNNKTYVLVTRYYKINIIGDKYEITNTFGNF